MFVLGEDGEEWGVVVGDGFAVGGGVSGVGGLEHGSVGFGGAGEVFELGGVQEGDGEGVDGPEGFGEVEVEVVVEGLEQAGVEAAVLVGEELALGGEVLDVVDEGVELGVVAVVPGVGDGFGQGVVEGDAYFDDVA